MDLLKEKSKQIKNKNKKRTHNSGLQKLGFWS